MNKGAESRYRRIVEATTEGIWEIDTQFRTTFVNQRMADLLGYTPEEMLGRPAHSFMFDKDLDDHLAKMTARQRGENGAYERRFRGKDGRTLWMIVSPTPLKDKRGYFAGSFAMVSDITERKQSEEALKKNRDRLARINDSLLTLGPDHMANLTCLTALAGELMGGTMRPLQSPSRQSALLPWPMANSAGL